MNKTFIHIKLYLLFLFLAGGFCFGQAQNVGKVLSWQKIGGGIDGKTSNVHFDIHAYSDHIIRVRISKNKVFKSLPYALENTEIPLFNANVRETGKIIEVSTAAIKVEIEKEPSLRITFKNSKGDLINEDVPGDCFGTSFLGGKISIYKKLQEGERFVGMGEALGNLDKRGTGITLNNTDTYKYGDPRLPMYISIPFYIGLHHHQSYGMFYNNSYKTFFNFGLSTPGFASVNMEGGDADYFFIYDESVEKIIEHYTALTGRMPLPPLWSIGYHQSRCTYFPQEKVKWIAETFRNKKIPVDCIVLDADYQLGYQPFRVDKKRFPDLPGLAADLARMSIELTASVYPGVKIDSTYESYTDGLKKDVFVKYADGSLFETEIAPLRCYLPDYTRPETREWWIDKMKWMQDNGIHGYWNDMNEPAIGGSYLPDDLLFNFDGRKANSLEAKNVYGFQMARSSFESAMKYGNGKRPFVLTRSAFAGVQRYSAVWSGDNTASDEGLLSGVLLNSQMGLSGLPFVGPDLGGYIGDGNKDLFKRWMEVGVFSPYVRNHKEFLATANEPWSYGEEAEAISKTYIGFRYRLMPYIYSKFYEASQSGIPIARSLCINYPFDDKVFDNLYQYQFLFGDAFLVVPVTSSEKKKMVYLPEGEWFDLFTDEKLAGSQEFNKECPDYRIPLFVKGSSIIPMQTLVQSTKEQPADSLFIHLYWGNKPNQFIYYEDDGNSFDYKNEKFCKRIISFEPQKKEIRIGMQEGTYSSHFKTIRLIFHGFPKDMQTITVNNQLQPVSNVSEKMMDPLAEYKDVCQPDYYDLLLKKETGAMQKTTAFPNSINELLISW